MGARGGRWGETSEFRPVKEGARIMVPANGRSVVRSRAKISGCCVELQRSVFVDSSCALSMFVQNCSDYLFGVTRGKDTEAGAARFDWDAWNVF